MPAPEVREEPSWQHYFEEEKVHGTIAVLDSATNEVRCSDAALCRTGVIPASTFKIANSMIALETGVVDDPETVLRWDGVTRAVPEWNQDHTLRSAIQASCVPCYQDIARRVGQERMNDWLKRLAYGNQDASGGIDVFWLRGGLRITPLQQLDFLRRFDAGTLPISSRTADMVRDIITLDVTPEYVLRGKTGLATRPVEIQDVAWFVGWVELGPRRVFFATLIDRHAPDVDLIPLRRRLTTRILRDLGYVPT